MPPEEPLDEGAPEPDDAPTGPLPDPLDRLWVHPSELRSFVAAPSATPRDREVRRRNLTVATGFFAAGVAATLLVLVAFGAIGGRNPRTAAPPVVTNPGDRNDAGRAVEIAQQALPSIVQVHTTVGEGSVDGSGVAVANNRVLTSAHLLVGATAITVLTADGKTFTGTLVGTDADTDLALVSVPTTGLKKTDLGSLDSLKVAQAVFVVSRTKGQTPWVSIGVVSTRNAMQASPGGWTVGGLVLTSADATPDTTGGGLYDAAGDLVGILTVFPGGGRAQAIPIDVAGDVQAQLSASGKANHGWLGVAQSTDATDRPGGGARVLALAPDSPAAKAGVTPSDVITAVGDRTVSGVGDLVAEVRRRHPGDPLNITVYRGGSRHSLAATLVTATGDAAAQGGA